ncbi:MAG: NFACT RNA binding domain-containing protein [bacterium]
MKLTTDFFSICLLVKGLQKFIPCSLVEVDFFKHGMIFKLEKQSINILAHPRLPWIFTGYFPQLKLQKATGWQQALSGAILKEVNQVNQDRVIELKFTEIVFNQLMEWSVWIELIGGFPNIYLTKHPGPKLVRFYRKSKTSSRDLQPGQIYSPPFNPRFDKNNLSEVNWQESKYSGQLENIFNSLSPDMLQIQLNKILPLEVSERQFYLLPGVKGFENQMKDPAQLYSEIFQSSSSEQQENKISEQQAAILILEQRNQVLTKKLNNIIPPPLVKKLGEQLKILTPDQWDCISIKNKKLNKVFEKLRFLPQGKAIEKIYRLYDKILRQQEIYLKLAEENKQLINKIKQGNQQAVTMVLEVMKPHPPQQEYRVFRTWSGKKIMISKKKEHADRLTFKIAKPHDYFFHCKDAPGAHTLLILNDKNPPLPQDIETASRLAATFSSQKKSNLVPILYTMRKYVRKPRKSPPGLVVVEREKVVMARPLDTDELILYQ